MTAGNEDPEAVLDALLGTQAGRLDAGGENGLAKLVLALVNLIHQLLESQALRRLDHGTLDDDQAERVGLVLMEQARQIDSLCREFGISPEELNIDLNAVTEPVRANTN